MPLTESEPDWALSLGLNHRHPVTVDALDPPRDDATAFHGWTQHEVALARGARDSGRSTGYHPVDSSRVGRSERSGCDASPVGASIVDRTGSLYDPTILIRPPIGLKPFSTVDPAVVWNQSHTDM